MQKFTKIKSQDGLTKAFKEYQIVIEKGTKKYNEALKKLDEVLARIIKVEDKNLTKPCLKK